MKRRQKPQWVKKIAKERIQKLLQTAKENAKTNPQRAKRYVQMAQKISTKYSVSIPKHWKKYICKKCGIFLIPGFNQKVRKRPNKRLMIYVCGGCGQVKKHKI